MSVRIPRKVVIISLVVIVLLGGAAAYAYNSGVFTTQKTTQTGSTTVNNPKSVVAVPASVRKNISTLVASGDPQSVKEATDIANAQVAAADSSGSTAYIVDAHIAKADLLIHSDQPQQALDDLLALEKQYGNDNSYKYVIYSYISGAYLGLGNNTKAIEYSSKIPATGGD
jgi:hypothetical protein